MLPNGDTHSAHFNSDFRESVHPVRRRAHVAARRGASAVTGFGGFTYEFDSELGVFQRSSVKASAQLLAERAETIGGGRFSFGFTFQNFTFDTIEGLDLDSVPAVFEHDGAELGGGRIDLVTTSNGISARVQPVHDVHSATVLTDSVDLSLAIPIVSTDLTVTSNATVQANWEPSSNEVGPFLP